MIVTEDMGRERLSEAILKIAEVPEPELKKLLGEFKLMHVPKKTIFINEGESPEKIFFLVSGLVRIFYRRDDREVTNWFIEENNFLAATYILFSEEENVYISETIEECYVLTASYHELEKLFSKSHTLEHFGRKLVEFYYSVFLKKSYDIMFRTPIERYNVLIDQHIEWLNRIPLKFIASYLGITQETLSRLRAK